VAAAERWWPRSGAARRIARIFAGPVMVAAGVNHAVMPRTYEAIMPDYLPAHRELVLLSGAAEALGGAGTLHPATRRLAGWWLVAVLVAVFPANLHMALHPERYPQIPHAALLARLPLQLVMVWLVWLAALARPSRRVRSRS
jgi:uncharacterized membrane protein